MPETTVAAGTRHEFGIAPKPEPVEPRFGIDGRLERLPITPPPAAPPHNPVVAATSPPLATTPTGMPSLIDTPGFDPAWSEALGKQVSMLVSRNVHNAELRLSPAELGPVQVQISVDDNVAKVTFSAGQAVTREALEQALPRLRDMFADQGMALADASVSDQRGGAPGDGEEPAGPGRPVTESASAPGDEPPANVAPRTTEAAGLLDTYA